MIFVHKRWEAFCQRLHEKGIHSIPACCLLETHPNHPYVVLKHDIETNVPNAFRIAEIEHRYGHMGSYYVQAYLMKNEKNVALLKQMQEMGHEISYHYDVMDSTGGNIPAAITEFEQNLKLFETNGFPLRTLCQHGNPVVERKGYHSNRDFFRNAQVKAKFPDLTDIMVDFKDKALSSTDYLYFSDAGRQFKLIYDPINNDRIPSDDKNVPFDDLNALWSYVEQNNANCIISIHPHRWVKSKANYMIKTAMFKGIKSVAKFLMKIPFMKSFMARYYYLAKRI